MRKEKYNWEEIQKDYNTGLSWREIKRKYGISWPSINRAVKSGKLKSRSRSESISLDHKKNPDRYTHTPETKRKLSEKRIKFLAENPDKVPYLLNHYSKGDSYPEKYFKGLFEAEKIELKHHLQIGVYQLDFYNLENKLDIEIDGDQHYLDPRIVESDKRRNAYLEERGWKVFRIKWSDYQRLSLEEKKLVIDKIKNMIKI